MSQGSAISGPAAPSGSWLAEACKLVIAARAIALLLTVADVPDGERVPLLTIAIVAAALASYVPLRHWDRVAPALMRRPAYLALEVLLAVVILMLTGTDSPFFLFTLGTAALGGLIYGFAGAGLFSVLLIGAYAWVFSLRADLEGIPETFQTVAGQPALYVIAALAGAAGRRLSERQAGAARAAQLGARDAAAERERARLARDMHDSLAKTVHGIALAAAALGHRIDRDPNGAAQDARRLAADAETAAREARGLIYGLREEGTGPLAEAVTERAAGFAERTGRTVDTTAVATSADTGPAARHELVQILEEALRNVERHAGPATVAVSLRAENDDVTLVVDDDGRGFTQRDPETLRSELHFGVLGMRERAELVGGRLEVHGAPGAGTTVTARVPARAEAPVEHEGAAT